MGHSLTLNPKVLIASIILPLMLAFAGCEQKSGNSVSRVEYELLAGQMQKLQDRQAITDVINHFARALDRMDRGLMRSTYWPDAIEEHQDPEFPVFSWNRQANPAPETYNQFACLAIGTGFAGLRATQHQMTNVTIDLHDNGTTAGAEAYVWAWHLAGDGVPDNDGVVEEGEAHEVLLFGRMLFWFEKREVEKDSQQWQWRILRRLTVFDWFSDVEASGAWSRNEFGGYLARYKGGRDRDQDGLADEWHNGEPIGDPEMIGSNSNNGEDPSYLFLPNLPSDPDPVDRGNASSPAPFDFCSQTFGPDGPVEKVLGPVKAPDGVDPEVD
jgi:hypothetical protein